MRSTLIRALRALEVRTGKASERAACRIVDRALLDEACMRARYTAAGGWVIETLGRRIGQGATLEEALAELRQ